MRLKSAVDNSAIFTVIWPDGACTTRWVNPKTGQNLIPSKVNREVVAQNAEEEARKAEQDRRDQREFERLKAKFEA